MNLSFSKLINTPPMSHHILLLLILSLIPVTGCGNRVAGVSGGTKGTLDCEGQKPGDVQLTLYPADGTVVQPFGFAVTQLDGTFELYAEDASGPLWLPTGKYRCTLESVGAPVQIPKAYLKPETTPLTVNWTEGMEQLQIDGPALKIQSAKR